MPLHVSSTMCSSSVSQNYVTQPLVSSPFSNLIAKIFLRRYKDANIKHLPDMKSIALCVRFVGDRFVIYDSTKTILHTIITYINKIHNNLTPHAKNTIPLPFSI